VNETQAKATMGRMVVIWPNKALSRLEAEEWNTTLARLRPEAVSEALELLKSEQEFWPSHHQVLMLARDAERRLADRQATERGIGPPLVCGLCDGTEWEPAEVHCEAEAVVRCRSSPRPEGDHAAGCSCLVCHYGAREAARIRMGWHNRESRPGSDPLGAPGNPPRVRQQRIEVGPQRVVALREQLATLVGKA